MTKEALKLGLEALESCDAAHITDGGRQWYDEKLVDKAITAIKEALANEALDRMAENARELGLDYEPEQEPVAWVDLLKEAQQIVESKVLWKRFIDGTPLSNDIACWMAAFAQQHTTPPQRTWIGLTDGEVDKMILLMGFPPDWITENAIVKNIVRNLEAKLKEKNG